MKRFYAAISGVFLLTTADAVASGRVFIVPNPADGAYIKQCLANGETCGIKAASAYCRSRDFARAETFRRLDPDEVTGSIPRTRSSACPNGDCDDYVAIICKR